jgi:hypothetical protein
MEPHSKGEVKQLKPLMHKGKSFFPIGAYSRTRPASARGFVPFSVHRRNGWNTVLWHVKEDDTKNRQYLAEADAEGFAVILAVGNLVKNQDRREVLRKVAAAKDSPALLGYYIFDEPENVYSASDEYKRLKAGKGSPESKDLGRFVAGKIGWVRPLIRRLDPNPEHYIFMCIAWWNHYKNLAYLCEINLPNRYPTYGTRAEFEGRQAEIVYDAKLAAQAVFETGQRTFCYTPFAVNIGLEEKYRYPTVNEFRYSAFAPITQGAMGIIFWAGYRCKSPYTEQVVFPVTRQLNELSPFFLGKWMDEKLECEPSEAKTALVSELGIPTISGCLRQRDDGKYLLLAVNNSQEKVSATFHLAISGLPGQANEFISGRKVSINAGVIKDQMSPYGVCAYVIESSEEISVKR